MAQHFNLRLPLCLWAAACAIFLTRKAWADEPETRQEIEQLRQQNQSLQEQLRHQAELIQALTQRVNTIQAAAAGHESGGGDGENRMPDAGSVSMSPQSTAFGKVRLSGEGGVAFFESGSDGMYPHGEFRLDEARLFVDASVFEQVYAYCELNLATREEPDVQLRLGEAYLDFENLSRWWGQDRVANLRIGRIYVPFGEEYQTRYAIDNPLISHSLSDLWGVDEGVELYGSLGKATYAVAVQNGGISPTTQFDGDKSVAGRIGFDPARWLHVSLSGMRTGHRDAHGDQLTALWFGNAFFRSIGSANTTKFQTDLVEGDVQVRLPYGHIKGFGGYIHYDDNDPLGHNQRDVYYYSVEGVHDIVGKLYGAARFSQIFAHNGFPIVGSGMFDDYFFDELTRQLWRLNLSLGYRLSQNLVLKAECSIGGGRTTDGESRDHEDLLGAEAAFRF